MHIQRVSKRKLIILIVAAVVVVAGIGAGVWALFFRGDGERVSNTPTTSDGTKTPREPHAEAVVSSNKLATDAGMEILDAGGSAADASVAVAAVLSVVEPFYSSVLGGDTWALYYDADQSKVTSVNGVGPAGSKATLENYRPRAGQYGIHQAILPGAWDGWMLWLKEYGDLELGEVLAPAIRIAREGYPVSTEMRQWMGTEERNIRSSAKMTSMYTRGGALLNVGDTAYQYDMATTFERLVGAYNDKKQQGHGEGIQAARDYFYRGPIADSIVAASDQGKGYLTKADFNNFKAEITEPISVDYTDEITVYQNPPASQGIVMLEALNILKGYDFSNKSASDPNVIHQQVEALKLAFADRYEYVGDPSRREVPVTQLLSETYAATQRSRIDMNSARKWPIEGGLNDRATHTTTFHIVDRNGDAAAITTSLGGQFLVIGDTGIHINERMSFMSLDAGNVNVVAPGKMVRHTSNPYMALRNGKPYILGGNTGVDRQPQGQVQQFMNVVEFGMSPQEAVAQARFISTAFPASNYPYKTDNALQIEAKMPGSTVSGLRAKGHNVTIGGAFGVANMLVVIPGGKTIEVGAEPRSNVAKGTTRPAQER